MVHLHYELNFVSFASLVSVYNNELQVIWEPGSPKERLS